MPARGAKAKGSGPAKAKKTTTPEEPPSRTRRGQEAKIEEPPPKRASSRAKAGEDKAEAPKIQRASSRTRAKAEEGARVEAPRTKKAPSKAKEATVKAPKTKNSSDRADEAKLEAPKTKRGSSKVEEAKVGAPRTQGASSRAKVAAKAEEEAPKTKKASSNPKKEARVEAPKTKKASRAEMEAPKSQNAEEEAPSTANESSSSSNAARKSSRAKTSKKKAEPEKTATSSKVDEDEAPAPSRSSSRVGRGKKAEVPEDEHKNEAPAPSRSSSRAGRGKKKAEVPEDEGKDQAPAPSRVGRGKKKTKDKDRDEASAPARSTSRAGRGPRKVEEGAGKKMEDKSARSENVKKKVAEEEVEGKKKATRAGKRRKEEEQEQEDGQPTPKKAAPSSPKRKGKALSKRKMTAKEISQHLGSNSDDDEENESEAEDKEEEEASSSKKKKESPKKKATSKRPAAKRPKKMTMTDISEHLEGMSEGEESEPEEAAKPHSPRKKRKVSEPADDEAVTAAAESPEAKKRPVYMKGPAQPKAASSDPAKKALTPDDVFDLMAYGEEEFGPQPDKKAKAKRKRRPAAKKKQEAKRGMLPILAVKDKRKATAATKSKKGPVAARTPLEKLDNVVIPTVTVRRPTVSQDEDVFSDVGHTRDCDDFFPTFNEYSTSIHPPREVEEAPHNNDNELPDFPEPMLLPPGSPEHAGRALSPEEEKRPQPSSSHGLLAPPDLSSPRRRKPLAPPPRLSASPRRFPAKTYHTPAIPKKVRKPTGHVSTPRQAGEVAAEAEAKQQKMTVRQLKDINFGFDDTDSTGESETEQVSLSDVISPVRGENGVSSSADEHQRLTMSPSAAVVAPSGVGSVLCSSRISIAGSTKKNVVPASGLPNHKTTRSSQLFFGGVSGISIGNPHDSLQQHQQPTLLETINRQKQRDKSRPPRTLLNLPPPSPPAEDGSQLANTEDEVASIFSESYLPPSAKDALRSCSKQTTIQEAMKKQSEKENEKLEQRENDDDDGNEADESQWEDIDESDKTSGSSRPAAKKLKQLPPKPAHKGNSTGGPTSSKPKSKPAKPQRKTYVKRTLNTSVPARGSPTKSTASSHHRPSEREKKLDKWASLQTSHFSEVDDFDLTFG